MGRYAYTPEQNAWLAEHYPTMRNAELAEAFEERFGEPVMPRALNAWGSNHHVRKTPETRRAISAASAKYTPEQLDYLREIIPGRPWTEIRDLYAERFGEVLTEAMICGLKHKVGVLSGTVGGRYRRGQEPPNKGKTWDEMGIPKETQELMRSKLFRKGELNEYNRDRVCALLTERETEDGTLIYVSPRNAKYPAQRWIPLGKFVWMQHHGRDWPDGHVLVYADHDHDNVSPENVFAVTRDVKLCLNGGMNGAGIEYHDPPTCRLAIAQAMLAIRRAEVEKAKPRRCSACGAIFRPSEGDYAGVRRCPTCREQKRYPKRRKKEKEGV